MFRQDRNIIKHELEWSQEQAGAGADFDCPTCIVKCIDLLNTKIQRNPQSLFAKSYQSSTSILNSWLLLAFAHLNLEARPRGE